MLYKIILNELKSKINPEKAAFFPKFFKAGKGEYAEGDKFLGITVPLQREIAKKYFADATLNDIKEILNSEYHECRLTALFMLVSMYENKKSNDNYKKSIVDFYLSNTDRINNWDLVDSSCYKILGDYLINRDRSILLKLAVSDSLWEQRIAMISTLAFIKKDDYAETKKIAEILLFHSHDLIHKAVGWMLREAGNRNISFLIDFLNQHAHNMPRTALRYAIEKLPEDERKYYLSLKNKT